MDLGKMGSIGNPVDSVQYIMQSMQNTVLLQYVQYNMYCNVYVPVHWIPGQPCA